MRRPLLALAAVTAAVLACPAADPPEPTAAEKQVLAKVAKLGGTARVDDQLDPEARVAVTLPRGTDATLSAVAKLKAVGSLTVEDAAKCTDRGVAALKELPHLRKLVLGKSAATDQTLGHIGAMTSLRALYVGGSKVTGAGLAKLMKLAELRSLDLMDTRVGNDGLAHLTELPNLEELNLSGTKVTDAGVPHLAKLAGLKTLRLTRTDVTRAGLDKLEAALPKTAIRY